MLQEASKTPSDASKTTRSLGKPPRGPSRVPPGPSKMKDFYTLWQTCVKPSKYHDSHYFCHKFLRLFNDFWKQLPFKIDQQMACKMECLILTPFEALQRPTMSQDAPKTAFWLPKTHPKRPQDGSKMLTRRLTTPSGWSQLRPAAPKAAKKPSKPRFWTLRTSLLDPPDLDFGPSNIQNIPIL